MIVAFLPLVAAVMYGLSYILAEKALVKVNIPSFLLFAFLIGLFIDFLFIAYLYIAKGQVIDFSFLKDKPALTMLILATSLGVLGSILTLFAISQTSAAYAAFAEVSYPLFTVLFLALFFGVRHFDWTLLLGGGLVVLGSFILIHGQMGITK